MELILGDCLKELKQLEDNSVDAIVTDPPYGLSFMGKKWDYDVPSKEVWKECLRVLKPGGHLLAFAGTRTQHRMAVNIEDAGFEIRDMIAWVYGSGFPKSLNIGKAVDKLQGNEREFIGYKKLNPRDKKVYTPNTETSFVSDTKGVNTKGLKGQENTKGTSEWEGWGTALKPALEPITVARKPLEKGLNVAQNCLKWGVGGINIDGCRVEYTSEKDKKEGQSSRPNSTSKGMEFYAEGEDNDFNRSDRSDITGRFPANLIHDGSDEVVERFPQTKTGGRIPDEKDFDNSDVMLKKWQGRPETINKFANDSGSAARFFYCAKASKRERNIGCEGLEEKTSPNNLCSGSVQKSGEGTRLDGKPLAKNTNNHPTVKPLALMEYLVKLVSREGQVVLDPFMGSGTTGMACKRLGREFIGIEMMPEYMEIAKARIEGVKKEEQLGLI